MSINLIGSLWIMTVLTILYAGIVEKDKTMKMTYTGMLIALDALFIAFIMRPLIKNAVFIGRCFICD